MENAADALKMAFGVLVFVIALSVTIVAFGDARQTTDTVISYRDRETEYIYGNQYYESDTDNKLTRKVNVESIIPTIYRSFNENYKIIFDKKLIGNDGLYKKMVENPDTKVLEQITVYTIDLELKKEDGGVAYGTYENFCEFINGILYKKFKIDETSFKKAFGISELNSAKLYDTILIEGEITEKIGTYYPDELNVDSSVTPEASKFPKRVITYIQ